MIHVSQLSLNIYVVSVKCSTVYLGCLSSLFVFLFLCDVLRLFSFLIFYQLLLVTTFFICIISYIYFFIFHEMSHGVIFFPKTILLFDEILCKIFKINVTICTVFICS